MGDRKYIGADSVEDVHESGGESDKSRESSMVESAPSSEADKPATDKESSSKEKESSDNDKVRCPLFVCLSVSLSLSLCVCVCVCVSDNPIRDESFQKVYRFSISRK